MVQKYRENNLPYMSDPVRQIGKNKLSTYAPIFANQCGFNDPTCHKLHGKRALGITMLSNSGTMKTHARYQHLMSESIEKKYKAMNPWLRSNASKCLHRLPQINFKQMIMSLEFKISNKKWLQVKIILFQNRTTISFKNS